MRVLSTLLALVSCLTLPSGHTSRAVEGQAGQAVVARHEGLLVLENRIATAADKAKRSVVRISWTGERLKLERSASGVILTPHGHVATFAYNPFLGGHDLPAGKQVVVHLADGRRAAGVAAGCSWPSAFGLVKIIQEGIWPHAELGSSKDLDRSEIGLALGYPEATHTGQMPYEIEPSVRVGHVVRTGMPGRLESSCRLSWNDRGGGLFDLEGRLLGVHTAHVEKQATIHSTVESVEQNWRKIARRSEFEVESPSRQSPESGWPFVKTASSSLRFVPGSILAGRIDDASQVTVSIDREGSGVVVTSDGYVATCAHHELARGTEVAIHFADGTSVAGRVLGKDRVLDVGLAKITTPGRWKHAAWGKTTEMRDGDFVFALGCPTHLRNNGRWPLVIRTGWILDDRAAPGRLASSCVLWGGDSGGGLFDGRGRLIGTHMGPIEAEGAHKHAGADLIRQRWDSLVSGPTLSHPIPFDRAPTARAFLEAIENVLSITVEVLGDGNRRTLGTIVSDNGYVLTKASELYGSIRCRLSDGRTFPAAVSGVARHHDLALLQIDATDLPEICWSERESIPVGSLVGVLRHGEPPAVGTVTRADHSVVPVMGYLGLKTVKDGDGGVEIVELWETDTSLPRGDVIVHIEGRPTPNMRAFEELTTLERRGRGVPFVFAGDPIRVGVQRRGDIVELRFPLNSAIANRRSRASQRKCGFPAVFDTDAVITKNTCGAPVVDRTSQVVGITIALPTELRVRVYVIPATIARQVANRLITEASE
jgi:serine protease Do